MDNDPTSKATGTSRRRKAWSFSAGPYGHRIRVFEDPASGILYGEMRDPDRPGHYRSLSLRHRDRDRAKRWAIEQANRWLNGDESPDAQAPNLSRVFGLYLKHQTPLKTGSEQVADRRRAEMWTRQLGAGADLSRFALRDWQAFIAARRAGAIDARGRDVPTKERQAVRDGTVAADLVFLLSVLNWAARWRLDSGRYLMLENPARGYPLPTERNPRRPVATHDRFQRVRAVADQVTMVVGQGKDRRRAVTYLPAILDIVNGTGRRISAVLALRYHDLRLADGPHGSIRWPADTDKMRHEWTVPISASVRRALDEVLAQRPGIGAAYIFPSVSDPRRPVAVEVASAWLLKAEALAEVEKQVGSLWHAYRRKWATERKFLPAVDVAAAGGWRDQSTLTQVYQQADQATMYRVVAAADVRSF